MRVLMTCGGTGGHINPAIAIANTVKENYPDAEILFVGTKRGKEGVLVPKEGYELQFVESMGIRRSLSLANIKAIYLALTSPYKAKKILREFQPDIVIGTGGYACWPVLKAATMMGIPSAVHESNAIPGMAVKRLQNSVDRIYTNFERTADFLTAKDKILRVGNPLRTAFSNMEKDAVREKLGIPQNAKVVLSYGGSGGAEFLNATVVEMMGKLKEAGKDVYVLHAAGSRDFEETYARYCALGLEGDEKLQLVEYIYDMPVRMAAADLVICRAGAMTVSELSMMGKASVMIPSPHVVDNHQYKNAKVLADAGATCLLEEAHMDAELLLSSVLGLLEKDGERAAMERAVGTFATPDTNRVILEDLLTMMKK